MPSALWVYSERPTLNPNNDKSKDPLFFTPQPPLYNLEFEKMKNLLFPGSILAEDKTHWERKKEKRMDRNK